MSIALDVLLTARALEKAAAVLFQSAGLTAAQFNVLKLLDLHPEGLAASALATRLIVDPSNVTGLIRRLKTAGWIESIDNPADRRQHVVIITTQGRRVFNRVAPAYEAALTRLDNSFKRAERTVLSDQLHRLQEAADAFHP